jgi:hypothetical protein
MKISKANKYSLVSSLIIYAVFAFVTWDIFCFMRLPELPTEGRIAIATLVLVKEIAIRGIIKPV